MSNRRLKAEAGAALAGFLLLACTGGTAQAQLANSSWPIYQHDLLHTGRTTIVGPSSVFIDWGFLAGAAFRSGPTVAFDGTIYAGGSRRLYAVNPGPGTQKWLADTVGAVKFSTPTVGSDGTIYVGARDNRLHAYNPDGSVKWQYLVGVDGDVSNAPAIGSDGTIYMGGTG